MPKSYNTQILDSAQAVKACVTNAKVSFKKTRETCSTLSGRTLNGTIDYLNNVISKKECVPMRRYATGCGNTKQAHKFKVGHYPAQKGRWPKQSAELSLSS